MKLEESTLYSDELTNILCELESFVTENRLNNVASHIGEVSMPRDFGKLIGLMSKDVFDDFMKQSDTCLLFAVFLAIYPIHDVSGCSSLTVQDTKSVSTLLQLVQVQAYHSLSANGRR